MCDRIDPMRRILGTNNLSLRGDRACTVRFLAAQQIGASAGSSIDTLGTILYDSYENYEGWQRSSGAERALHKR